MSVDRPTNRLTKRRLKAVSHSQTVRRPPLCTRLRLDANSTLEIRVLHELAPKQFHGGWSPFELRLGDVCRQVREKTGHGGRRDRDRCVRDNLRLVDYLGFCHGVKVS